MSNDRTSIDVDPQSRQGRGAGPDRDQDDRCPEPTLELELARLLHDALATDQQSRAGRIEQILVELRREKASRTDLSSGDRTRLPIFQVPFSSWEALRAELPAVELPKDHQGDSPEAETAANDRGHPPGSLLRCDRGSSEPPRPRLADRMEQDLVDADLSDREFSAASSPVDIDRSIAIAESSEPDSTPPRRRSVPMLFSGAAHLLILLMLMGIGIEIHRPKDQVALTGAVVETTAESMETFELKSSEPADEPTESEPIDVQAEIRPLGEVAISEWEPNATASLPAQALVNPISSTASVEALHSDSKAQVKFLGVEGGGNHFVYLVDGSRSMGEAFPSARRALIESIEALEPKQRFYVIFYDRDPDFMRISDPSVDEARSVYATAPNKAALQRWAMQISMDHGWAPYEPIRFALQLKPDVIFLLSDGEFPQKFEDQVKQENWVANLFGDRNPISIIHTISYHSQEGENRMRRIAEQNGGQYRHIPKP